MVRSRFQMEGQLNTLMHRALDTTTSYEACFVFFESRDF
jgi:hypothetical protein